MSPFYFGARQVLDPSDGTANGPAVTEFRAHLRAQRGPAVRGIGSGLVSGVGSLAGRLRPPVEVELEPMPEDTFGSGWTPDTDITSRED